jgi:hypothetical protein
VDRFSSHGAAFGFTRNVGHMQKTIPRKVVSMRRNDSRKGGQYPSEWQS